HHSHVLDHLVVGVLSLSRSGQVAVGKDGVGDKQYQGLKRTECNLSAARGADVHVRMNEAEEAQHPQCVIRLDLRTVAIGCAWPGIKKIHGYGSGADFPESET